MYYSHISIIGFHPYKIQQNRESERELRFIVYTVSVEYNEPLFKGDLEVRQSTDDKKLLLQQLNFNKISLHNKKHRIYPLCFYIFYEKICYNKIVAYPNLQRKGGDYMECIYSFILSILASVVAYYICKWLDRE